MISAKKNFFAYSVKMKIQDFEKGCRFWVKASPRAHKNESLGWETDFLKIKIHAIPAKGDANEKLIEFLSFLLNVPKSKISICKGHTSRFKQIQVEGFFSKELEKKIP